MLNKFYQFTEKIKNKNRLFKYLSNNKAFRDKWQKIKWYLYYLPNDKPEHDDFFEQNATRVSAILNRLADTESKQVYDSIVKFRTTSFKKNYSLKLYNPLQYFIEEVTFEKNEVFVDCGAYNGDTIDDFIKYCPNYKQIIAFEPETDNFKQLKAKHGKNPKISLLNTGVWDKNEDVYFAGDGASGSIVTKNATNISVKSIDSLELDKVTFIKMDVEGAEMNALKGAARTILRDKPKLAICIYHSHEDMLDVPEYIHSLVPEYKFYVRQHHLCPWFETVLYAML